MEHPGHSNSNGNRHVTVGDGIQYPPLGSDIKAEEIDNIIEYHCRDGNNLNIPPNDIEVPITKWTLQESINVLYVDIDQVVI